MRLRCTSYSKSKVIYLCSIHNLAQDGARVTIFAITSYLMTSYALQHMIFMAIIPYGFMSHFHKYEVFLYTAPTHFNTVYIKLYLYIRW